MAGGKNQSETIACIQHLADNHPHIASSFLHISGQQYYHRDDPLRRTIIAQHPDRTGCWWASDGMVVVHDESGSIYAAAASDAVIAALADAGFKEAKSFTLSEDRVLENAALRNALREQANDPEAWCAKNAADGVSEEIRSLYSHRLDLPRQETIKSIMKLTRRHPGIAQLFLQVSGRSFYNNDDPLRERAFIERQPEKKGCWLAGLGWLALYDEVGNAYLTADTPDIRLAVKNAGFTQMEGSLPLDMNSQTIDDPGLKSLLDESFALARKGQTECRGHQWVRSLHSHGTALANGVHSQQGQFLVCQARR